MKIARIDVIPVRAPRREVVRSGDGSTPVDASEFGVVRIIAENGLAGVGEISITYPRIGHSLCHVAEHVVAPRLIGLDALSIPAVLAVFDRTLLGEASAPYIRAAFEMALLDLTGKRYDIPVFQLLGGRMRSAVPLAWGIYHKSPDEMANDARAAVAEGYGSIKLKVGRKLEEDLAAIEAVRDAAGRDLPLRLDANMAYRTVPEAVTAIEAFARVAKIAWVEQPLGRHNLDGLRQLRQRCGVPIMADESLQSPRDAYEIARAEAADVFNVYVFEAGGLGNARQIFEFAHTLDIPGIIGSQAEMGIGTAAAAHLGVSLAHLPYPCETFGPLRYERDVVSRGATIANGQLTPRDAPGLGVELGDFTDK